MSKTEDRSWLWLSLSAYICLLFVYGIFSYALTAPNLVYLSSHNFWQFQTWMWRTFFNNRPLLTQTYLVLIAGIFGVYALFIRQLLRHRAWSWRLILVTLLCLVAPLFFSNNALSYDVFNYIFNAKMVSVYGVDPHLHTALEFPDDPWTKFMHNVHTPAPYGRGWTYLSLLPFTLGLGKFITTWLSFRFFNLLPLFFLGWLYWRYHLPGQRFWLAAVLFNPLVLIEVASNIHNDLWMMAPAIWALIWLDDQNSKVNLAWRKPLSLLVLIGTIWIKMATVVLLPIWVIILFKDRLIAIPQLKTLSHHWALLASCLMFLPLLTARSQQFHPWYLLWPLSFVPLIPPSRWGKIWSSSLLVLSLSSLYRYLPFLWNNNYDGNILWWSKLITFVPWGLALICFTAQAWFIPQTPAKSLPR